MSNCIFAPWNWVWEGDAVAVSGGAWSAGLPLANLLTADALVPARSAGLALAQTQFLLDLGQARRFDTVGLFWVRAGAGARVRLTALGDVPGFDHDYLTGALPAGSVFARASQGRYRAADGSMAVAAVDAPRFHHDAAGALTGLLIEEARTNLVVQSSAIDGEPWGSLGAGLTADAATAPDGTTTADLAVDDDENSFNAFNSGAVAFTGDAAYTLSWFCKPAGREWVQLGLFDGVTNHWANFNVASGATGQDSAAVIETSTEAWADGWMRCRMTVTTNAGAGAGTVSAFLLASDQAGPNPVRVGDGASGMLFWGCQCERGAFPSSYIPTEGSTATRSADTHYLALASAPWWPGAAVGTIHAEAMRPYNRQSVNVGNGGGSPVVRFTDASNNEKIGEINLRPEYGGHPHRTIVAQESMDHTDTWAEGVPFAAGLAWSSGSSAFSTDGEPADTDAGTFATPAPTRLYLGSTAVATRLDGCLRRVTYWASRKPDARLEAGTVAWADYAEQPLPTTDWMDLRPVTHAPVGGYIAFGRASADGRQPEEEADPRGVTFVHRLAAPVDARFLLVELDDEAGPLGAVDVACVVVARAEAPALNLANGFAVGQVEDAVAERSLGGALLARRRWTRKRVAGALRWVRRDEALATWLEMARNRGRTRPVLLMVDPEGGIHRDRLTILGTLEEPSPVEHLQNHRFGWPFAIVEL